MMLYIAFDWACLLSYI